jgi:hypothetical protein
MSKVSFLRTGILSTEGEEVIGLYLPHIKGFFQSTRNALNRGRRVQQFLAVRCQRFLPEYREALKRGRGVCTCPMSKVSSRVHGCSQQRAKSLYLSNVKGFFQSTGMLLTEGVEFVPVQLSKVSSRVHGWPQQRAKSLYLSDVKGFF